MSLSCIFLLYIYLEIIIIFPPAATVLCWQAGSMVSWGLHHTRMLPPDTVENATPKTPLLVIIHQMSRVILLCLIVTHSSVPWNHREDWPSHSYSPCIAQFVCWCFLRLQRWNTMLTERVLQAYCVKRLLTDEEGFVELHWCLKLEIFVRILVFMVHPCNGRPWKLEFHFYLRYAVTHLSTVFETA